LTIAPKSFLRFQAARGKNDTISNPEMPHMRHETPRQLRAYSVEKPGFPKPPSMVWNAVLVDVAARN
jgi:hypothetical protein